MEQNALHRKEVNWIDFKRKAYALTKGVSTMDSLVSQFPLLFEWINDFHGGISANGKWLTWEAGKPKPVDNPPLDSAIRKGPFLKAERWGDIGYFRVPGGITKNVAAVTQMLADSLCKIDPSTVKGWVIDLRLNTGGNIWFMLPPLATLIGDGETGGALFKGGNVYANNQIYSVPHPQCQLPGSDVPVVVLAGSRTASSGEGVLLAFKHLAKTVIIGEQTSGFITSNNSYSLPQDITLILATSHMKDRKGIYYTQGVKPDIVVEGGDNFYNLSEDSKIKAALSWLDKEINSNR